MSTNALISTPLLRQLAATARVGELIARGVAGGFILVMRDGGLEQTLAAQKGGARIFKRLETLATYLTQLGIYRVTVELEHWSTSK